MPHASVKNPKVSVAMITYNHEKFIGQAIESVLMQETDFPVEIVIGEDGSTDNTRRVVQGYAEKHPGRIRLLAHGRNLGMNANLAATLAACRGEYIALLEGDDFWTDRQKLARQSAFLDTHPDCVNCFHNVTVVSDDPQASTKDYFQQPDGSMLMCAPDMPSRISQNEFLKRNVIPTCSVMLRKSSVGILPAWFHKLSLGDQPLHVLCTEHGLSAYFPAVMGAYRLHGTSAWSGKADGYRISRTIEMIVALERHFQDRPQRFVLLETRLNMMKALAQALQQSGQLKESILTTRAYLRLSLRHQSFSFRKFRKLIKLELLSRIPWVSKTK
jgi:glycosyltransferase involved in cell wall biosynthesis